MNGVVRGKQRYRCKGCGRVMCGFPIPETTLAGRQSTEHRLRCPNCKGAARIHSREKDGRCRLRCTVCGRNFTDIYRNSPPVPGEGPFPHARTFNLGPTAVRALTALSQKMRLSNVQVIRWVLRQEFGRPPVVWAISRMGRSSLTGKREMLISRPRNHVLPPQPEEIKAVFPNRSAEIMRDSRRRALLTDRPGTAFSVHGVAQVRVCMDDQAKAGLVRAMRRFDCDNQNALRRLLAEHLTAY